MNCKDIGIELLSVDIFSAEVYQLRWKILTNTDQEIFFFFFSLEKGTKRTQDGVFEPNPFVHI